MEDVDSECILLTLSCIDYLIFGILDYDVKEVSDAELGETADTEEVIGVDLEDDELEAVGW